LAAASPIIDEADVRAHVAGDPSLRRRHLGLRFEAATVSRFTRTRCIVLGTIAFPGRPSGE